MSVAAVGKKDGSELRNILMSVPFNMACRTPKDLFGSSLDYGLLGGGALCQLECPEGHWNMTALDEHNAYTYIETPEFWWPFMSGPAVRARDLPASWVRGRWAPDEWICPQHCRLGMGMAHAVLILQRINERVVRIALDKERWVHKLCLLTDRVDRQRRVPHRWSAGEEKGRSLRPLG